MCVCVCVCVCVCLDGLLGLGVLGGALLVRGALTAGARNNASFHQIKK